MNGEPVATTAPLLDATTAKPELDLELIKFRVAQKPVLRGEVGART